MRSLSSSKLISARWVTRTEHTSRDDHDADVANCPEAVTFNGRMVDFVLALAVVPLSSFVSAVSSFSNYAG